MRCLILGGNGQVGLSLFKCLKAYGWNIVCSSRRSVPNCLVFNPFKDSWSILGSYDIIINCIGIIKETRKKTFELVHIELIKKILSNRSLLTNPIIINISALGANCQHISPFLKTKGIGDEILLQHEKTYVLKPSIVCTSNSVILEIIKKASMWGRFLGGNLWLPENVAKCQLQPVMPEDIAECIFKLMYTDKRYSRVIELGGAERYTYADLLKLNNKYLKIRPISILIFEKVFILILNLIIKFPIKNEFQLLLSDNICSTSILESILGHKVRSTKTIWKYNEQ